MTRRRLLGEGDGVEACGMAGGFDSIDRFPLTMKFVRSAEAGLVLVVPCAAN
jgi:hypothetical protein